MNRNDRERTRCAALINGFDFSEELGDAADEILAAVRTGDHTLIGRVVEAVYLNYADQLATQAALTDFDLPKHSAPVVCADEAARMVLLAVSVERAAAHRAAMGVAA